MSKENPTKATESAPHGFYINEKGEEVPITEEMVAKSMEKVKLQSIGAHTGYTKAITDDMLPPGFRDK